MTTRSLYAPHANKSKSLLNRLMKSRRRTQFETLEDRCVLAGDPTVLSFTPALPQTINTTSSLQVTFTESVQNANNVASYTLLRAGGDGTFGTGDVAVAITSAVYANNTVTLNFAAPLPDDLYRLTINDDFIIDLTGSVFDGDLNGIAGGDFVVQFEVDNAEANDAPTVTIDATSFLALEQTALQLTNAGIVIADIDAGSSDVVATLSTSAGGILTATAGSTGALVSGSGTTTLVLTGTVQEINALLNGQLSSSLNYTFNGNTTVAADTLTISVNDQGATGGGGSASGSGSISINLVGVNDAPTATIALSSYTTTGATLDLDGTGIVIADVDAASNKVRTTISVSSGTLQTVVGTTGVTVSGNNTNTLTLTGTVAQVNSLLAGTLGSSLVYVTPAGGATSAQLTVLVNDLGNTGIGGVLTASATVGINGGTGGGGGDEVGIVIGFNPVTGQWQATTLTSAGTSETEILATWSTLAQAGWRDGLTGDFDGDGVTDIFARTSTGGLWVGDSESGGYNTTAWGVLTTAVSTPLQVADVNADGRDDLVGFNPQTGDWVAAISTGTSFTNTVLANFSTAVTWTDHLVADFTGDGRADVAARVVQSGEWWLGITSATPGAMATADLLTSWSTAVTWRDVQALDYNGDNRADIVGRADYNGQDASEWWLSQTSLISGTNFSGNTRSLAVVSEAAIDEVVIADIDDNGDDEILTLNNNGQWFVINEVNGTSSSTLLGAWADVNWVTVVAGDVDGDGRDELIGRQASGAWIFSTFPTGAGSQIDTFPATWSSSVDWLFTDFGLEDDLLFN